MQDRVKQIDTTNLKIFSFAKWEHEVKKLFISYLIDYERIPKYKRLLNVMINFEEMYRPIYRRPFRDPFGIVKGINEGRQARRLQVYMNKKDLISAYDEKKGRRWVITSRGHKVFYRDYPLAVLRKEKWDKVWTVVMYDIPENRRAQRNKFRSQLIRLGCGSPQKSVWVTPLKVDQAIDEFVEGEKLKECVWVLRAERVLGLSDKGVARRSWPLDKLSELYSCLVNVLPKIKKSNDRVALLDEWRRCFLAVNACDPHLPQELLPEEWQGIKCEKLFERLGFRGLLRALLSNFIGD